MTGAETAWSDKDLDPGKLFFWRVLAGGVPCQACQGEYHLQRYRCDVVFHIVSVKIKFTYRHILFSQLTIFLIVIFRKTVLPRHNRLPPIPHQSSYPVVL